MDVESSNRAQPARQTSSPASARGVAGAEATLGDRLITWLTQHTTPHHALSRLMYRLTRARWRPWKRWQIRWFVRRYQVDMSIAQEPDLDAYPDFNTFFTRALKPGARPIVPGETSAACPVDGAVSQAGAIDSGTIFQAKGHSYDVVRLLGGSAERAAPFRNGRFATLYLSPRDYHRIHMPLRGELQQMVYIPGRLFSVNPRTTRTVPELFARNERVVAIFATEHGPMALVLVGAMFVANIETVWAGVVAPRASNEVLVWDYRANPGKPSVVLEKGQEMGRFNMGSTVIVLFADAHTDWHADLAAGAPVRMGQELARWPQSRP